MELLTEFYTTKITLNFLNHEIDLNKLISFIDSLSFNSNTIINLITINQSNYIFQIIGKSENIKNSINILTSFQSIINNNLISEQISYQIELPNFEKDFIAGKKNGKIIKIMNMSSVSIKILPFNDYSLIIKINCNNLIDSILGLGLFEDELPKILTFNVPESFHRQIIGVGGQTIQTIMRKFNVFIKFSNSFELNENSNNNNNDENSNNNNSQQLLNYSNFQQSFIRKNNVVIKCPSKNKDQIILAKLELERLVDKVININYNRSKLKLLNSQWKLLTNGLSNLEYYINKKKPTNFITELEKYTNTFIKFPLIDDIEFNQLFINLEIFGVDNNSKNCCNELFKLLPYEYTISIDLNDKITNEKLIKISKFLKNFKNILDDSIDDSINDEDEISINFLNNIIIPLKLMYNVELLIDEDNSNIRLFYFTDSFDKNNKSDINNINNNNNNEEEKKEQILNLISSKVLTLVEQTKFIENSKDFQFMISTLIEFLNSNSIKIKFQSVTEPTFIVEHLPKNNKATDKDSNSNQNNSIESVNNIIQLLVVILKIIVYQD
ncbi:unnamed protein product [[Candida] boidinii]|nr:unnamed protein product [[Candida] boidinii]